MARAKTPRARQVRMALGILAVAVVVSALPASAPAALPVEGARYVDTDFAFVVDLHVLRDGRRLRVETDDWSEGCHGAHMDISSGPLDVRVGRDGRFGYVRTRARLTVHVRGRFVSRNRARIFFRYTRRTQGRLRPCARFSLRPERIRRIPFRDCRPHRARTVALFPGARIFWQRVWDERDGWTNVAFGCLFSADKRIQLGKDNDDDSDLQLFRSAGPYLAYVQVGCSAGCGFSIHVTDLRDGGMVHLPRRGDPWIGPVTDIVLGERGSVAWISRPLLPDEDEPASVLGVWAFDGLGYRRLDSGGIDPRSLELSGSTVTWVKQGALRSATLD